MFGAILGDMIGAPYEFDRGDKTKDFPLFREDSQFTDDSVMTVAVAEALLDTVGGTDDGIRAALVKSMRKWGRRYPYAGYGGRFIEWLYSDDPQPYNSWGNGSAMRVSAAGWLGDGIEEVRRLARLSAEVTHNHPEGIKGAEAVASAIYLARTGKTKAEIKNYIVSEFGYDLSRSCDGIRPDYRHVESCQQTVPEALTAFLEGISFEDVIRTAVSLGGDCDTLTCIAGSVAEAFYGIPKELLEAARDRLTGDILEVETRLYRTIRSRMEQENGTVVLNVTYRCRPGMRDKFLDRIREEGIAAASREEEGNLMYDYYIPAGGGDGLLLVEKWRDEAALASHASTPHFKRLGEIKSEYVLETTVERYRRQ